MDDQIKYDLMDVIERAIETLNNLGTCVLVDAENVVQYRQQVVFQEFFGGHNVYRGQDKTNAT